MRQFIKAIISQNKTKLFFFLSSIVLNVSLLIAPVFLLKVVVENQWPHFLPEVYCFSIVSYMILYFASLYGQNYFSAFFAEKISQSLREKIFNSYLNGPSIDTNIKNAAQVSSELITHVQRFQDLLENNVLLFARHCLFILGSSIILTHISSVNFFLTLIFLPLLLLPHLYFSKQFRGIYDQKQTKLTKLEEYIFETFSQLRTVQILNHQKLDKMIIGKYVDQLFEDGKKVGLRSTLFFLCYFICALSLLVGIVLVGLNFIEEISASFVTVFSYLMVFTTMSLYVLGKISPEINKLFSLGYSLNLRMNETDTKEYKSLRVTPAKGLIAIHNVSFSYPSAHHQMVLHDINVSFYPGETIAIVGPSGAGKTTLLNLLVNFYNPTKGKIYLDGEDTASLNPMELRDQVALVDQEPELFSASVYENILYGNPSVTDSEVEQILELVMPEEKWQLPKGLRTPVGPRGSGLSIGQKQCIALARALLRNTPILLLDEATSGIDIYSEELINRNLEVMLKGRTTITVTHKLPHILMADRVLLMHAGRIVAFDTHTNLYENNALYRKLILLESNQEKLTKHFAV